MLASPGGFGRSLLGFLRWKRLEREMDEEMRLHIQLETEQLIREGLPAGEARRRALIAFGGLDRFKEEARDGRGLRWLRDFGSEVRQSLRALRSRPSFTISAVGVLGLGFAGAAAILGLADATLRHPPPFATPERLYMLAGSLDGEPAPVSWSELQDWAEYSRAFDAVSAYKASTASLTEPGSAEEIETELVSWNYFDIVGAGALHGRAFREDDEAVGGPARAVMSHGMWVERYSADPAVVGSSISINESPVEIVGVAEPGFSGLSLRARLWLPAAPTNAENRATVRSSWLYGVGRTGSALAPTALEQDLARTAQATQEKWPGLERGIQATRLDDHYLGRRRGIFRLLVAGVLVLLALGWLGVGSMLTARAVSRAPELGMRVALGASRGRIISGLLAEALAVTLPAAVLGLVGAWGLQRAFVAVAPPGALPGWVDVQLSWEVLLTMLGLTAATVLALSASTALWAAKHTATSTRSHRRVVGGGGGAVLLRALSIAQVAVSVALLAAAGHLVIEYRSLAGLDPGVRDDVFVARVAFSQEHSRGEPWLRTLRTLIQRLEAQPEVESAASVSDAPMRMLFSAGTLHQVDGREVDVPFYQHRTAPGYFRTVGLPLLEGRDLAWTDRADTPPVAVISARLAQSLWPDESALGRFLPGIPPTEVVGVVGDARTLELAQSLEDGANGHDIYYPVGQHPGFNFDIVARGPGDPAELTPIVRDALATADPRATFYTATSVREMVRHQTAADRLGATLMVSFALQALLITAIGVYGLLSFVAARKRAEIAIRLALGGSPRDVAKRVIVSALRLGALGAGAGAALSFAASTVFSDADGRAFLPAAATAVVMTVVAAASLGPALRASRVQPAELLRSE